MAVLTSMLTFTVTCYVVLMLFTQTSPTPIDEVVEKTLYSLIVHEEEEHDHQGWLYVLCKGVASTVHHCFHKHFPPLTNLRDQHDNDVRITLMLGCDYITGYLPKPFLKNSINGSLYKTWQILIPQNTWLMVEREELLFPLSVPRCLLASITIQGINSWTEEEQIFCGHMYHQTFITNKTIQIVLSVQRALNIKFAFLLQFIKTPTAKYFSFSPVIIFGSKISKKISADILSDDKMNAYIFDHEIPSSKISNSDVRTKTILIVVDFLENIHECKIEVFHKDVKAAVYNGPGKMANLRHQISGKSIVTTSFLMYIYIEMMEISSDWTETNFTFWKLMYYSKVKSFINDKEIDYSKTIDCYNRGYTVYNKQLRVNIKSSTENIWCKIRLSGFRGNLFVDSFQFTGPTVMHTYDESYTCQYGGMFMKDNNDVVASFCNDSQWTPNGLQVFNSRQSITVYVIFFHGYSSGEVTLSILRSDELNHRIDMNSMSCSSTKCSFNTHIWEEISATLVDNKLVSFKGYNYQLIHPPFASKLSDLTSILTPHVVFTVEAGNQDGSVSLGLIEVEFKVHIENRGLGKVREKCEHSMSGNVLYHDQQSSSFPTWNNYHSQLKSGFKKWSFPQLHYFTYRFEVCSDVVGVERVMILLNFREVRVCGTVKLSQFPLYIDASCESIQIPFSTRKVSLVPYMMNRMSATLSSQCFTRRKCFTVTITADVPNSRDTCHLVWKTEAWKEDTVLNLTLAGMQVNFEWSLDTKLCPQVNANHMKDCILDIDTGVRRTDFHDYFIENADEAANEWIVLKGLPFYKEMINDNR